MRQRTSPGPPASFLDAVAFLTRVPVPARGGFDLAGAAWAFPVVGALVGAVVGVVAAGGSLVVPVLVAAVLAVVVEVVLTGALHLDGLADCADGCGGRDRASRLAIMKDHSVGVYGVAAVALDLLLKVALLHGLLVVGAGTGHWWVVAVTAAVWALSRTMMLPLAVALPYARAEGTGRALVEGLTWRRVVVALGVAGVLLTVAAWVSVLASGTARPGVALVVATPVVATTSLLVGLWARRTLDGVTGDVLGATAELTLLSGLLVVVAVV